VVFIKYTRKDCPHEMRGQRAGAFAMMGSAAAYAHACNPPGWIDAQCYPDLQAATAANQPLWLPAGTYTLTQTLIDHAPVAATGFQIISDGAILDGRRSRVHRRCGSNAAGGDPRRPEG
jgi:hypothetical protein